jgi:Amt family ammonium transporter
MGKPKKRWIVIFAVLVVLQIASLFSSEKVFSVEEANLIDKADTAWMIVATAFVLFMTPGLSFF